MISESCQNPHAPILIRDLRHTHDHHLKFIVFHLEIHPSTVFWHHEEPGCSDELTCGLVWAKNLLSFHVAEEDDEFRTTNTRHHGGGHMHPQHFRKGFQNRIAHHLPAGIMKRS